MSQKAYEHVGNFGEYGFNVCVGFCASMEGNMSTENWTAKQWIAVIRDADSLNELKRLVGPSDEANEDARERLEAMDRLWLACKDKYGFNRRDWPDGAREMYERLQAEQDLFESQYC